MVLGKKGHARHSLPTNVPCWSRTLQEMRVHVSKLIYFLKVLEKSKLLWKLHQYRNRGMTIRHILKTVSILHGQVLEFVTSANYLGVDISNGPSWSTHIDYITANANQTVCFR